MQRRGPAPVAVQQPLDPECPPPAREGAPSRSRVAAARRASAGRLAEDAVADYLHVQGIDVLERNLRVGRLEIDVLARDGCVVAVVEVRTRGPGSWKGPLASVDCAKQDRLRRAGARVWRDRFAKDMRIERMRFDIAAVTFEAGGAVSVEYVKAAFLGRR